MKQNHILKQLNSLPQITLSQLNSKYKIASRSKQFRESMDKSLRKQNYSQNPLIDVKQPFYIDRFKHLDHKNCHVDGECLACKFMNFNHDRPQQKKTYLHSNRNKQDIIKFGRFKTQRESIQNNQNIQMIQRKLKSSFFIQNTSQNVLMKILYNHIRNIDLKTKQKFLQLTGKKCDDPLVLNLCGKLLKKMMPKNVLNSIQKNKRCNLLNFLFKSKSFDLKKIILQSQFIKSLKQQIQLQRLDIKQFQIKNNYSNLNIIQTDKINSLKSKSKMFDGNKNRQKNKKKVKILQSQSEIDEQQQKQGANIIYGKLFIKDGLQLDDEVMAKLNQLAKKRYRQFKGTVRTLDNIIHEQVSQQPNIHQNVTKKLQVATDYIKKCIPSQDDYQYQKFNQIDKLLFSVRNMSKNSSRRSSLAKNNKNQLISNVEKNYYYYQQNKVQNQKSKKSIGISRKKSSMKQKASTNQIEIANSVKLVKQKQITSNTNQKNNEDFDKSTYKNLDTITNSQYLIEQQMLDQVYLKIVEDNQRKASCKKSDIKSSSIKKLIFRHSKIQQTESQTKLLFGKGLQKNINIQPHKKKCFPLQINNEEKQNNKNKPQITLLETKEIDQKIEQPIKAQIQKQRRKKLILRIKAAQLLKQNQELIINVQNQLKLLNMKQLIINEFDSVLTQKKKIRIIRQLIRVQSFSKVMQSTIINQIIEYLLVYQENCRILIQRQIQNIQISDQSNWLAKNIIDKKQFFNDLLFYDLKSDFVYGRAEQQDINFTFGGPLSQDFQFLLNEQKRKRKKQRHLQFKIYQNFKQTHPLKTSDQFLIQADMPNCIRLQTYVNSYQQKCQNNTTQIIQQQNQDSQKYQKISKNYFKKRGLN